MQGDVLSSPKVYRALRLLSQKPAHELVSHPLDAIAPLIEVGFATASEPYFSTSSTGKRTYLSRVVRITDAGKEALSKHKDRRDAG